VEHLRQVLIKGPDEDAITVKWVRDGATITGVLSGP
jgi:hypothetical protein